VSPSPLQGLQDHPLICHHFRINLRVSKQVLSMASHILRKRLATLPHQDQLPPDAPEPALTLTNEDGDALLLLCNILHLRNDRLPPKIPSDLLYRLALQAEKLKCSVAVGRATVQWFDRIFHAKEVVDDMKMVEAAYWLDEPVYFARFSERLIRNEVRPLPFLPSRSDFTR
jgi:hypothetical protein